MNDVEIRKALQSTLLKKFYQNDHCKVVEELNVCYGDARIDIAVLNGSLWGFEIKSEYDTLQRLSFQVETYLKVFDYITVISAPKHSDHVLQLVPTCCGVASIFEKGNKAKVEWLKKPTKNTSKDSYSLCQLLWKEELLQLLKEFGLTRGLSGKSKFLLWRMLADQAPPNKLSKKVTQILKNRDNWKEDPQLR